MLGKKKSTEKIFKKARISNSDISTKKVAMHDKKIAQTRAGATKKFSHTRKTQGGYFDRTSINSSEFENKVATSVIEDQSPFKPAQMHAQGDTLYNFGLDDS